MGEHPTTQNEVFKATFMVPYQPGRLKAVGVEKGREIETVFLQTAGEPTTVRLTADHQSLKADGQDLVFVEVALTDDKGVIHPTADQRLSISV
ncbi:MAG TPA: beta-galactosidase, partial [Bacteroidales bacterium]|nr:beta-galactosidase [Bacteroidales bacterium]